MQAPTWIEKSTALKLLRDHEMNQHTKKMSQIATTNLAITEAKKITQGMRKARVERQKTKEFRTNERNIVINKDN